MIRSRAFVAVGALTLAVGLATSSQAATPYAELGVSYTAFAPIGDGQNQGLVFGMGERQTTTYGPFDSQFVCAWVIRRADNLLDYGCGSVPLTVDPLLRNATVTGTVASGIHKVDTFEYLGPSEISFEATWTGRGAYEPVGTHSENVDLGSLPGWAYLQVIIGGLQRQANATGSVRSTELGTISGTTQDASLMNGLSLSAYFTN